MIKPKYNKLEQSLIKLFQGSEKFHQIECNNIIHFYETNISRLENENYFLEISLKESENSQDEYNFINFNSQLIELYKKQKNSFLDLRDNKKPVSFLIY